MDAFLFEILFSDDLNCNKIATKIIDSALLELTEIKYSHTIIITIIENNDFL